MPNHEIHLSDEAYHILCGLVQDEEDVNGAGIFSQHWDELRRVFPLADFEAYVETHPDFYDADAGM